MKRMITTMTMTALMVSGFATTTTQKVDAATTYKVKVTADGLRVRTGPSTAYKVVGSVNSGQTFNYLGVSGSWTKISYGGTSRYISSTYAKKYSVTTASKASSGFSRPASGRIAQGYGAHGVSKCKRCLRAIPSITESTSAHQRAHRFTVPSSHHGIMVLTVTTS
ncbi:SH3 domain-containing protein [Exiguobacterium antarcticum]|uniref:SH3 domain-containing protein n=1 Tax=Exiguobacterium antarcticum TaxID=132920 RepID=UPI0002FF8A7D|nr:SH3 domain-containing protein [Exiguobacterium antarcticum]